MSHHDPMAVVDCDPISSRLCVGVYVTVHWSMFPPSHSQPALTKFLLKVHLKRRVTLSSHFIGLSLRLMEVLDSHTFLKSLSCPFRVDTFFSMVNYDLTSRRVPFRVLPSRRGRSVLSFCREERVVPGVEKVEGRGVGCDER